MLVSKGTVKSTDFEDGNTQWFSKCSYGLHSSLRETSGGKREFLEQSIPFCECIPRNEMVVLAGDMNGHVGSTNPPHTHNRFTALWILSGTTRVSWHQKKHSPTHNYCNHQSSLICLMYDPLHPPCSIHVLTVFFHNLSPSFLWSTYWPGTLHFILHTFLHPIIVFLLQHMPIPSQPASL